MAIGQVATDQPEPVIMNPPRNQPVFVTSRDKVHAGAGTNSSENQSREENEV